MLAKNETPGRAGQGSQTKPNHAAQSLSENSAPVKPWQRWFEKFGAELISVIPHDAESDTIAKPLRGKCPGERNADGKWGGRKGALSDRHMTETEAKTAHRTGAVVGILGRKFPALDIDTALPALAQEVADLAETILGSAPSRGREGSSRRLLMYRGVGHRKRRLEFRPPNWKEGEKLDAIEWLGDGQYYNVEGLHPSGAPYQWAGEHPCDLAELPEADADGVSMIFEALPALLERHGCTIGRASTAGAPGSRKAIGDPSMAAPSPQHVLDLLAAAPCTVDRFRDRNDIVAWLCGVKASLGDDHEEHRGAVLDWFLGYPGAEQDYFTKIWDSIDDAAVGWDWLDSASGAGIGAQIDFVEHAEAPGAENMPPDPGDAAVRALTERFVYCRQTELYYDEQTCEGHTTTTLRSAVAPAIPYGSTGTRSAEALFQNSPRARKVAVAAYLPGAERLVQVRRDGAEVRAINLWKRSALVPMRGASVEPWLNIVEENFGPPGSDARERFLDHIAFIVQRPGEKISYAPVLQGIEGCGKDSILEAFRRVLGAHNVATVHADAVLKEFNSHWIMGQAVIVNEANNFVRRETMDALKPLIARPPNELFVNAKHQRQFSINNIINVFLLTNHPDALAPSQDDRRYWVHRCLLTQKPSEVYFNRYWGWLDSGGDAAVYGFLLARDVSQFNPHAPAPMTTAKQDMIDLTQPAPLRWCRDLFREGGRFEDRKLVAAADMVRAAEQSRLKDASSVNSKWALAALKAEGFANVGQIRDGKGGRLWLWVRDPSGLLSQLTPAQLKERYREEAGLACWGEASA